MPNTELSRTAEIVRTHDPDRFFTALFAPPEHRETILTLYAFNHELARASEVAREPIGALIRLQWWREVLEGARRRHEVAGPLGEALDSGRLLATDLMGLVDAREMEVEPIPDLDTFIEYVRGTAGGVMVAAARALGAPDPEALRQPGSSYGISGILRRPPAARPLLPSTGGDRESIARLGQEWARMRPTLARSTLAAALPLTLARRRLRGRTTTLTDRLAVLLAALSGRP